MTNFDNDTLDGIRAHARYLANYEPRLDENLSPAWGEAMSTLIDYVLAQPIADLERVSFGTLTSVAQEKHEGLSHFDAFQATMMLAGGWANLFDVQFLYQDTDGTEYNVGKQISAVLGDGEEGRHPVTGEIDPDFDDRTVMIYVASDKLKRFHAEQCAAQAAPDTSENVAN
jgi:hypothetical protein